MEDRKESNAEKNIKIILLFVGLAILASVVITLNQSGDTYTNSDTSQAFTQTVRDSQSQIAQDGKAYLVISNTSFKETSGYKRIVGEIKNNDKSRRSATLRATFYDSDKKILGTAVGAVNEIEPAQTKTFELLTSDNVTGYKDYKVEVDSSF